MTLLANLLTKKKEKEAIMKVIGAFIRFNGNVEKKKMIMFPVLVYFDLANTFSRNSRGKLFISAFTSQRKKRSKSHFQACTR